MERYYKYQQFRYGYPTEAERDIRDAEREAAHNRLMGLVPRQGGQPEGESPFGLGVAAGLSQRPDNQDNQTPKNSLNPKSNVSRPYKKQNPDKDEGGERQGQGQLVSQVTPGKLRKNPTVLDSLIKSIWDFFASITNRPQPVDDFMAKYPNPTPTA